MTKRNGKIYHALGLEELISLKWPYYPKQSTDLMQEQNGKPLQYSCLENSMDRGARWATVYGVAKSDMTKQKHTTITRGGAMKLFHFQKLTPSLWTTSVYYFVYVMNFSFTGFHKFIVLLNGN